jgi:nitric oxide reductase subunit B
MPQTQQKELIMGEYKKLWWLLLAILAVTFAALGWSGVEIYRQVPPIPAQVITPSNKVLMTKEQILDGQTAWQSTGGMQVGSIWGHGAYQAPDWSADWLHRELLAWLEVAAQEIAGVPFAKLDAGQQAVLKDQLKTEYRRNTLNAETGVVTVSERRAKAMADTAQYYQKLYGADPELQNTRKSFAMKEDTLPDAKRREDLTKFFFWLSWAASTERPNSEVTYTNNWPKEPLVDNHPSTANIMWSVISVVVLLAGIAFLVWGWAFLHRDHPEP